MTQTMPHAPEAEEAIIGSILIDPECLGKIALDASDFYIERNRYVYIAARDLRNAGMAVDYTTIISALEKTGKLATIGGPARLTSIMSSTFTSYNAPSYADIVKEKAKRRRIIEASQKIATAAFNENMSIDTAVSAGIDDLSRSIVSSKGAVHISNYLSALYDDVDEAMRNPRDIYGLSTGYDDWDTITGGLQAGEVVRLSGEPGLGKSLLLVEVLKNIAKSGHPIALYELEMSGKQVVRRLMSSASKISTKAMQSGKITPEQFPIFVQELEELERYPAFISDSPNMTTMEMRIDLERLIEQEGIECVGIDYESLFIDEGSTEFERRNIISDRVHAMIKDLGIACISIGDMTKDGIKGDVKGQAALAGSAHELHNADQIILMRADEDNENIVNIAWEKLREGQKGRGFRLLKLDGLPAFGPVVRGR